MESYSPINPALLYWTADALQQPLDEAQETELTQMANGLIPPDEKKIRYPFLHGHAEDLMRRAAQSTAPCDWGLPIENGFRVSLVYVRKMLRMTKALRAKAELCFARHHTAEGQDLLLDAHRMARHTGAGKYLHAWTVANSLDDWTIRAAGRHCLGWEWAARRDYAAKLEALPPMLALAESYRFDRGNITHWLERLAQATGPHAREELETEFFMQQPAPPDPAHDPVQWDEATWTRKLEESRALQRRTVAALSKPWKESQADLAALAGSVQEDGSSLYQATFELPPRGDVDRHFDSLTRRTMLDAALRYGAAITEADAAHYQDACEGKPLRLKKDADGTLSLAAAEQHPRGKEVELKLGGWRMP